MRISDTLLPEFEFEMANTRKVLARVPDEKWNWKPHPKSFSMGDLAAHVMGIPHWLVDTLTTESMEVGPSKSTYQQPKAGTQAELLEKFDRFVFDAGRTLISAEDDDLMKPWALLYEGKTVLSMPRNAIFRSFIMNHLIHHRGQLSVYLRLNDIPVPGLYGPSADEQGT